MAPGFLGLKIPSLSTVFLKTHAVLTSSVILGCQLHPGLDISRREHHRRLTRDRGCSRGAKFMLPGIVPCSCTPPP